MPRASNRLVSVGTVSSAARIPLPRAIKLVAIACRSWAMPKILPASLCCPDQSKDSVIENYIDLNRPAKPKNGVPQHSPAHRSGCKFSTPLVGSDCSTGPYPEGSWKACHNDDAPTIQSVVGLQRQVPSLDACNLTVIHEQIRKQKATAETALARLVLPARKHVSRTGVRQLWVCWRSASPPRDISRGAARRSARGGVVRWPGRSRRAGDVVPV
jgi:hypothetical protein